MDMRPKEVQDAEFRMRNEWAKLKALKNLFFKNIVLPQAHAEMYPGIVDENNMVTWKAVEQQEKIYFAALDDCMNIMENRK